MEKFEGYVRVNGTVGTRNYLAIIPTVFCANEVAARIAQRFKNARALLHHQGCGQLKPDVERVTHTLIGLARNPNVGAVLLVGLGCESVSIQRIYENLRKSGPKTAILVIQKAGGMKKAISQGIKVARELNAHLAKMKRRSFPLSALTVGIKCGSSDASSGLVTNPAVGLASDWLQKEGGAVVFGETTEFMGAEHLLAQRAATPEIAARIFEIVNRMEDRIKAIGVDMRGSQPSPGNIAGGITTIEEKSLGAICKSGSMPIEGVLEYGSSIPGKGLYILDSPGKEAEIMTGLAAAGANVIIFTTGGGAPQGFPIMPVIKVAGNPQKCRAMKDHIDVDAGGVLLGKTTIEEVGKKIFFTLLSVAGGKPVKAETLGYDQTVEIYTTGPTV